MSDAVPVLFHIQHLSPIASHSTEQYILTVDQPHPKYAMRDFIVDYPDQEQDGEKIMFKLQVAKDDEGKVVGKKGKHAQALRTLLMAVAAKEGKRAGLEIAD